MSTVTKPSFHLKGSVTAPAEIRELQGWLIWRVEVNEAGKRLKVPYYANREKRYGKNGGAHERTKLVTFAAAVNAASRHGFDGVGLALMPEFNLTVLDFDHCVSGGRLNDEVAAMIADTYAEFSPSGTGVHAIYRGAMPNKKSHANAERWGFETFHSKGFVTFSGNVLDTCSLLGNEDTIAPVSPTVMTEFKARFGQREKPEGTAPSAERLGLSQVEAREWLARLDPDLGYDEWLRTGMALHHEFGDEGLDLWDEWSGGGSKYAGSDSLMTHWRSFGRGDGPPITMRSVAKLAGVSPSGSADADEFPDESAGVQAAAQARAARFTPMPLSTFTGQAAPTWVVKGVLPRAGLVVLFGESGSGKSFMALDMAAAIARGVPWRGHKVKQGRVVYIAAEGAGGFRNRCVAYLQDADLSADSMPLEIIADKPNLLSKEDGPAIASAVGKADVIVIDTFAQVTPGGNENAGEDMGKALAHCAAIHQATGAVILLVHHSGKDSSKGARGWSGIRAAADAELEVIRSDTGRYMRATKQKDGDDQGAWGFTLETVGIGVDEDGDPITSCVVREAEINKAKSIGRKLGPVQAAVNEAVQELAKVQLLGIEQEAVVELAVSRLAPPEGRDTRVQVVKRALTALLKDDEWPYELEEDGTISVL